ncbi:translation initiation factor eIF-2B gamma subunit [Ceratobasidium sp. AG-Ba]|nr:translation initiation factor eIF-2B gamma subunit [Ceratobasidium sp. AG-Ba]QRW08663.1 translation initiation factor eIF-2B gamma subunit [Ceratobasidium sp. AG-Ba]
MISHVLHWIEDCGISDVLVVCPSAHKQDISHHLHRSEYSNMTLDLVGVDQDDLALTGTAQVLREIEEHIKLDVIVLPCDFIPPPSLSLTTLLNAFREDVDEPIAAVLLYERTIPADGKDKGPKLTVGLDEATKTLLYVDGDDDDEDELEVHMGLTTEFPKARFTTRYLDSHVYVLRRSVLGILREHKRANANGGGLPKDPAFRLAVLHTTMHVHRDPLTGMITTAPTSPDMHTPYEDEAEAKEEGEAKVKIGRPLRTAYVVHRAKNGFAARGNTIAGYMELNRQALSRLAARQPGKVTASTAHADSIVPASVTIDERASIKRSVIGEHCQIGKNVKITGCVVMDHVQIGEGAKLDNCIVSRLCEVGERAILKECELETSFKVPADANLKGEKLES